MRAHVAGWLSCLILVSGCLKLSTEAECRDLSLDACAAQGATCAVEMRCEGPGACSDPQACSDACQPQRAGACVKSATECLPGNAANGGACKRVEPSPCREPGAPLPDGGAACRQFECVPDPNPCEACTATFVRCAGRPTPLFGR